ncbi:MAG: DUF5683 domain-containing protein [Schleiferiaceae bacterium]
MTKRLCILLLLAAHPWLSAQEITHNHSHSESAKHNIKTATTLALIPGAGQAYNKKYWKIPIVWGAIGGAGYYYTDLDNDFKSYREILELIIDQPALTTLTDLENYAPELFSAIPSPFYQSTASGVANETIGYMEALRTQREYAFFGIIGVYILSILDANIDAHLYDFDVNDDLSIAPSIIQSNSTLGAQRTPGIKLTLSLP